MEDSGLQQLTAAVEKSSLDDSDDDDSVKGLAAEEAVEASKLATDEFDQDAIKYQVLLEKIDTLLDKLGLDA